MTKKQPLLITLSIAAVFMLGFTVFSITSKQNDKKTTDARAEAQQDFAAIETALEKYYATNNEYPNTIENLGKSDANKVSTAQLGLSQADTINSFDLDYTYGAQALYPGGLRCKYYLTMTRSSALGDTNITEYEIEGYKCSAEDESNVRNSL